METKVQEGRWCLQAQQGNAAAQRGKGAMSSPGPGEQACPWSNCCLHQRTQCRHVGWWEDQGLAPKIFPQRFSRRKSLCSSYICVCCTVPASSQELMQGWLSSPSHRVMPHSGSASAGTRKQNQRRGEESPLETDPLSKHGSHKEQPAIEQPPKNCLAK